MSQQQAFPHFPSAQLCFPYSQPPLHPSPYIPLQPYYTQTNQAFPQQAAMEAQAKRSRGNEYLLSLGTALSNLQLYDNTELDSTGGERKERRERLYSMPEDTTGSWRSPNINKQLPPLPCNAQPLTIYPLSYTSHHSAFEPSQVHYCHAQMYGKGNGGKGLQIPPPMPPRPQTLPLPDVKNSCQVKQPTSKAPSQTQKVAERKVLSTKRPQSDPVVSATKPTKSNEKKVTAKDKENANGQVKVMSAKAKCCHKTTMDKEYIPIIDLTQTSSDSSPDSSILDHVTPRSSARRKRLTSDLRQSFLTSPSISSPSPSPRRQKSPSKTPSTSPFVSKEVVSPSKFATLGQAVTCSGFTRTGQPCKRLVKVPAPYLIYKDSQEPSDGGERRIGNVDGEGDVRSERVMGRYCKDHAKMICDAKGFYWRSTEGDAGIWIDFDEYIPKDSGQQTQTLLRMAMESKLTAKEAPGFLYAYELKDLETDSLSFYKIGRTDNVPRRIGQWTNQCQSKTPTLLDIFPLPHSSSCSFTGSSLYRSGSITTSFLPGATTHRTPPLPAMKRWERLVHMELSDKCAAHPESHEAFLKARMKGHIAKIKSVDFAVVKVFANTGPPNESRVTLRDITQREFMLSRTQKLHHRLHHSIKQLEFHTS
ncbi:hypothetical protein L204_100595 [Cryptococcus depauperatus]